MVYLPDDGLPDRPAAVIDGQDTPRAEPYVRVETAHVPSLIGKGTRVIPDGGIVRQDFGDTLGCTVMLHGYVKQRLVVLHFNCLHNMRLCQVHWSGRKRRLSSPSSRPRRILSWWL